MTDINEILSKTQTVKANAERRSFNPDANPYMDDMKKAEKLLLMAQTLLTAYDIDGIIENSLQDLDHYIDEEIDRIDSLDEQRSAEDDVRSI